MKRDWWKPPETIWIMNFLRFLFSRVFLKHFSIAIGIIFVFSCAIFLFLRIFTRHGQALSVPDLKGLSIEQADSVLTERNLRMQIVDSVYNINAERGSIIEQNPRPEFKVKENRTIFLTINAFNPEIIPMPNVVGVSLRQAGAIIQTAGLKIGRLTYVPDIAVNNVLQQKYRGNVIEEGDSIVKGSEVDLVLGRGLSNERTAAPDLVGMLFEDAKLRITNRYLNLGAVIYDQSFETADDSAAAFVWKQRPVYDEEDEILINLGSSVDVWITVDSTKLPQPDELELPEYDGGN
jgi:beta-lactam-binding protein with PASTA domain